MFRVDRVLVLAIAGLTGACGSPPPPPATAPPPPAVAPSVSFSPLPPPVTTVPVPTTLPTLPTYPTFPATTTPTPVYTPPPVVTTTTPPPGGPSPAPRCASTGPSPAQLIAAVKGTNGIPDRPLSVIEGPFCSGSWHFSVLELQAQDAEDKFEPLSVVTKGQPSALRLVEAGTDVCSAIVQNEAPPSIRVRACGA